MNARVLLGLPWHGPLLARRWIALAATGVLWTIAIALAHGMGPLRSAGWHVAAPVLAFWTAGVGVVLASQLRVALEARRLRLPGLERAAAWSAALYALGLFALSAAVVAGLTREPLRVIEWLALGFAGGFTYALLPAWLVVLALMSPGALRSAVPLWRGLPMGLRTLTFSEVALALPMIALVLSVACWRRALRQAHRPSGWFSSPMVLNFSATRRGPRFLAPASDAGVFASPFGAPAPQWLQPDADLRDAGPSNPARALRVALGGAYLPLTWRSVSRRGALFAALPAVGGLLYLPSLIDQGWHSRALQSLIGLAPIFGLSIVLLAGTIVRAVHVVRRWRLPGGELAVLPLLPRLAGRGDQTRDVLRVLFAHMRLWDVPLIAAALLFEALFTHDLSRTLTLAMVLGLAPAGEVAVVYATLGRCTVPSWAFGSMLVAGQLVFIGGLNVATLPRGVPPEWLPRAVALGAVLSYLVFATLSGSGRRALRRLPHPFLGPQ